MADTYRHPGADYRNRLPASVADSFTGPNGEPCFTPTDRRWLWRIEAFLAVSGTNDVQRQMGHDLQVYLRETCEHHWIAYEVEQCLWCNELKDGWPTTTTDGEVQS